MFNLRNLILLTLLMGTSASYAELKTTQGDYELHYNTFPSTFLSKDIANTYQIIRSKNRGIVSISILNTTQTPSKAQEADIEITAKNLLNQSKEVKLVKIVEADEAIYYLGTFAVNNQEDINFSITATPKGSSEIIKTKFSREFYSD